MSTGPAPGTTRSDAWIVWVAIGSAAVLLAGAFAGGVWLLTRLQQQQRAASYHALVVYTTWDPDQNVTNGPEPGYRPAMSGLTGNDIAAATAHVGADGTSWVVDVTFTPRGKQLFAALTKANVNACPGDPNIRQGSACARRHLAIWLDLTAADIQRWDDAAFVAKVSGTYDLRCLASASTGDICPKFITDPLTLEEIDGGEAEVSGAFSRADAEAFVQAINPTGS